MPDHGHFEKLFLARQELGHFLVGKKALSSIA